MGRAWQEGGGHGSFSCGVVWRLADGSALDNTILNKNSNLHKSTLAQNYLTEASGVILAEGNKDRNFNQSVERPKDNINFAVLDSANIEIQKHLNTLNK